MKYCFLSCCLLAGCLLECYRLPFWLSTFKLCLIFWQFRLLTHVNRANWVTGYGLSMNFLLSETEKRETQTSVWLRSVLRGQCSKLGFLIFNKKKLYFFLIILLKHGFISCHTLFYVGEALTWVGLLLPFVQWRLS